MDKPAPVDHPIMDALQRRWSPRAFDPNRSVDVGAIRRLLEAARWAPSSRNEQPWRYLVFDGRDPDALAAARSCLNAGNAWALKAPLLLLAVAKTHYSDGDRRNRMALHDTGMATLSLVLQAVSLGLIAHQMAGYDRDQARAAFNIPEGFRPLTMIAVGYYGRVADLERPKDIVDETKPRERRALTDISFDGAWDRPFR